MWNNDEDNNPYGSFDRRDSTSSPTPATNPQTSREYPREPQVLCNDYKRLTASKDSGFDRPSTPNSEASSPANEPPEFVSQPHNLSDDGNNEYDSSRKKVAYGSRIEQLLYENQDLQIVITDAGKSQDGGTSFISYTIRTGVSSL